VHTIELLQTLGNMYTYLSWSKLNSEIPVLQPFNTLWNWEKHHLPVSCNYNNPTQKKTLTTCELSPQEHAPLSTVWKSIGIKQKDLCNDM
jgi:hypothetical protein